MMRNHIHGRIAEIVVVLVLVFTGFKILHRRFKSPLGEIDIIAKRGDILRFVEVKSRSSRGNLADLALSNHQLERIKRGAMHFVGMYNRHENRMCIDVFFVYKMFWIRRIVAVL